MGGGECQKGRFINNRATQNQITKIDVRKDKRLYKGGLSSISWATSGPLAMWNVPECGTH